MNTEKTYVLLLQHRGPALGLSESIDRVRQFERLWTKVFLIDHAVVTHDERLYARDPVLRGKGYKREAAYHHVLNNEVQLAERRRRSLPLENLEKVAVKGLAPV